MVSKSSMRRFTLYSLVGSVAIGALLAIFFVLANSWGWFEIRIILSTTLIAGASLCIMACEIARTPKGWNVLPYSGFTLTAVSALLLFVGMWTDFNGEFYWKLSSSLAAFAVATVHVCLLSVVPLTGKFKWVFFIAMQVIYGVATLVFLLIFEFAKEDDLLRLLIVMSIIATALSLVIPLLSRISKTEDPQLPMASPLDQRNIEAIDQEIDFHRKRIVELEKLRASLPQA